MFNPFQISIHAMVERVVISIRTGEQDLAGFHYQGTIILSYKNTQDC